MRGQGFFRRYGPVFLAGKNVYKTPIFKRGVKNKSCNKGKCKNCSGMTMCCDE